MRLCTQCGSPMRDADDFCGNCGTYLGWAATTPKPGTPKPGTAAPRTSKPGIAEPRTAAPGTREPRTWEPGIPEPVEPEFGTPEFGISEFGIPEPGIPGFDLQGFDLPGSAEPEPEKRSGPVPPGRPVARRPLPSAVDDEVVIGPPCPACGVANPPGRRFCRRCATPLISSDVSKERAQTRRRWRWHGDRSRWLRRLAAVVACAMLLVAAILFYPNALALIEDIRDKTSTPVAVGPASSTATAEVPGHPAAAAVDGLSNRYWGATAVGDTAEFGFTNPFRLLSVVVHTGAGVEEKAFLGQARVTSLDMVVTSVDGVNRTIPVPLADRVGPQRVDTAVSGVVRIRLVVRAAAGLAPGRHIALGEVEFFRRP